MVKIGSAVPAPTTEAASTVPSGAYIPNHRPQSHPTPSAPSRTPPKHSARSPARTILNTDPSASHPSSASSPPRRQLSHGPHAQLALARFAGNNKSSDSPSPFPCAPKPISGPPLCTQPALLDAPLPTCQFKNRRRDPDKRTRAAFVAYSTSSSAVSCPLRPPLQLATPASTSSWRLEPRQRMISAAARRGPQPR